MVGDLRLSLRMLCFLRHFHQKFVFLLHDTILLLLHPCLHLDDQTYRHRRDKDTLNHIEEKTCPQHLPVHQL